MKTLKVGFDLDGVILDNPLRSFRVFTKTFKFLKPLIFHQKKEPFYYPKTKIEQILWQLLHKTSFRLSPAIFDLKILVNQKKIEAYLITGRYQCLFTDFTNWVKKIKKLKIFKNFYFNKKNLQPDKFKIKMINKLNLDIYFEDNWDIIEKLNSKTCAKIFWITNFFDQFISYPYKFKSLKEGIVFLEKNF